MRSRTESLKETHIPDCWASTISLSLHFNKNHVYVVRQYCTLRASLTLCYIYEQLCCELLILTLQNPCDSIQDILISA